MTQIDHFYVQCEIAAAEIWLKQQEDNGVRPDTPSLFDEGE